MMANNKDNNCANLIISNKVPNSTQTSQQRTSHQRFFERLYGHLEQSDKVVDDVNYTKDESLISEKTDEVSESSSSSSPGLKSDFGGTRCDVVI